MTETVIVASRAHMAFTILMPNDPEKPGLTPELPAVTINGSNHPSASGEVGITRDVPADVFRAWHKQPKEANAPLANLVYEVSEEDANKVIEPMYGFEPGLEKMASNADNTSAAQEGSTITHEGNVTASEMAATSNTPPDDSPRSEPALGQATTGTVQPATEMADPQHEEKEKIKESGEPKE